MIIAVDGPAGSGKSTVSKEVAKRLGITFLDSGALYRTCAYIKISQNLSYDKLIDVARESKMHFGKNGELYLTMNDLTEEVSGKIRTPEIASEVPKVAALPEIRQIVTRKLREMSVIDDVIMDGRDIGTHVFPDADLKFFLVASSEERAKRRMKDYTEQGIKTSLEEIIKEVEDRDRQDMNREHSPLKKAEDAFEIDTTSLTIEQVISIITSEADN